MPNRKVNESLVLDFVYILNFIYIIRSIDGKFHTPYKVGNIFIWLKSLCLVIVMSDYATLIASSLFAYKCQKSGSPATF